MTKIEFERLDETRNRLLDEINSLSFEEVNKKPDPDTWSIAQVCHHVSLAELSFAKAIRYGLKQESNLDLELNDSVQVLTDRSRKVTAPDIVNPGNEPLHVNQLIGMLNDSRKVLLDILNSIEDPSILTKKSVKHLLFGEVSLYQWIQIVYLHEQRHIEQIEEIKSCIV